MTTILTQMILTEKNNLLKYVIQTFLNLFSNLSYIIHVTHLFHLHKDLKRASAEIYYPSCILTFDGVFLYHIYYSYVKVKSQMNQYIFGKIIWLLACNQFKGQKYNTTFTFW